MQTVNYKGQRYTYHFGLIRINTKIEILKWKVSLYRLERQCSAIYVKPATPKARAFGYKTQIGFVNPTREFFKVFKKVGKFYSPYRIAYIELVRCKFGGAYDKHPSIFDRIKPGGKKSIYYKRERLKRTIYPKNDRLKTKIYSYEEWEIRGAGAIKKRTGAQTMEDLENFNMHEFWGIQYKPISTHESEMT